LTGQVTVIEGDIFQLDRLTDKFDYVLAEAILTMQSAAGKAKILSAIKNRLKPHSANSFAAPSINGSSSNSFTATLQDLIEYPTSGILSRHLRKIIKLW
jgi:hypothetical protein